MKAPFRAPLGTADALREFAAEALGMAQIQAELAATYAAIGDDTGLHYATRKLAAYTEAALATVADLDARRKVPSDGPR